MKNITLDEATRIEGLFVLALRYALNPKKPNKKALALLRATLDLIEAYENEAAVRTLKALRKT